MQQVETNTMQPKLSANELMALASTEAGLDDFGDTEFIESFHQLIDSASADVAFTEIGSMLFKGSIHRLLVNRLRFTEDLRLHPQILDEDVSDPIVVMGLARTGTTKLQRMMSADPDVLPLKFWQLCNPAPFPSRTPGSDDPRIEMGVEAATAFNQICPEFKAVHSWSADEVDEETLLMNLSFKSLVHYVTTPAHGYYQWLQLQPLLNAYHDLKRLVQYLQWQKGGKQGRPWILKSPLHIGNIDSLLEVFPSATMVFCHRDVTEVIPSCCRLIELTWGMVTENQNRHEIGQRVLNLWAEEMRKHLAQRGQLEGKIKIFDVSYKAIKDDPINVVREIYRHANREFTSSTEHTMNEWLSKNPANLHGKNIYCKEDYGLTDKTIESAFDEYLRMFKN